MTAPTSSSSKPNVPSSNDDNGENTRVRVVARIRPLSRSEEEKDASSSPSTGGGGGHHHRSPSPIRKLDGGGGNNGTATTQLIQVDNDNGDADDHKRGGSRQRRRWFEFDAVCDGQCTQADVYRRSGAQDAVRHDLLAGINTSILAYGQTGAGKTYTMMGTGGGGAGGAEDNTVESMEMEDDTDADEADDGIIPRACADLFRSLHEKCDKASVSISYLELYNEQIRDLLQESDPRSQSLRIRESPSGTDGTGTAVQVVGAVERKVKTVSDVNAALREAGTRRVVAATAVNATSSRSHAVCTLRIKGILKKKKKKKNSTTQQDDNDDDNNSNSRFSSKLTLVDLAGSERIKKTGARGTRQTEGININKSLLVLGQVVSALASSSSSSRKPPYRDSKLTRLLQDSLGGNSRTILLACVSPAPASLDETTNTLRYAASARRITNRVRQNVTSSESSSSSAAAAYQQQVTALQKENTRLDTKVHDLDETVKKLRRQLSEAQTRHHGKQRPTTPTLSQSNYTASTATMSDDDEFEEGEETSLEDANTPRRRHNEEKVTPSRTAKVPQQINVTSGDKSSNESPPPENQRDDGSVSSAPQSAEQQSAVDPLLLELSNHKLMVAQLKERLDMMEDLEAQNEDLHRKLGETRAEADTAHMAATYLSDIVDELRDIKQGALEKKKQELQLRFKEKRWVSFVQAMLENFRTNAANLSNEFEMDVIRMLENLKIGEGADSSVPPSPSSKNSSALPIIPVIAETPGSPVRRSAERRSSCSSQTTVPSQDELLRMAMESPRASPRRRMSMTGFSSYLWKQATTTPTTGTADSRPASWKTGTARFQQKIRRVERMIAAEAESMRSIQTNLTREYNTLEQQVLEQQTESESLFSKDNGHDLVDHLSSMLLQRPAPTVSTCATFS